ncbi:hypothetical protein D9Q98_003311 [Chlorella vulgaris]|uniref:Uncharacterized protein n=1 Tax=Chlorella vulgaris TaxID=3077 RepID=A0A9D4TSA5_CHLVU|nr:hypothetical protein D9Q98_003311 [Chlorella vulgaris]
MASEAGRISKLPDGRFKVVFSHGGKEYDVQPLVSSEDAAMVCDLLARGCKLGDAVLADLVEQLNAFAADVPDGEDMLPMH